MADAEGLEKLCGRLDELTEIAVVQRDEQQEQRPGQEDANLSWGDEPCEVPEACWESKSALCSTAKKKWQPREWKHPNPERVSESPVSGERWC